MRQTLEALSSCAPYVADAELMWVTPDMTRVALDASRDLPEDWTLALAQPWPSGLIAWKLPLPTIPVNSHSERPDGFPAEVPLDAVLWTPFPDGEVLVRLLTLAERIPGGRDRDVPGGERSRRRLDHHPA